jgi:hypothetical protein
MKKHHHGHTHHHEYKSATYSVDVTPLPYSDHYHTPFSKPDDAISVISTTSTVLRKDKDHPHGQSSFVVIRKADRDAQDRGVPEGMTGIGELRNLNFAVGNLQPSDHVLFKNNGVTIANVRAGDIQDVIKRGDDDIFWEYTGALVKEPDKAAPDFRLFAAIQVKQDKAELKEIQPHEMKELGILEVPKTPHNHHHNSTKKLGGPG